MAERTHLEQKSEDSIMDTITSSGRSKSVGLCRAAVCLRVRSSASSDSTPWFQAASRPVFSCDRPDLVCILTNL